MRRSKLVPLPVLLALAVAVPSATANTVLSVSTLGADTGNCQIDACATLGYAVAQAASVPDTATIDVGPGTYEGATVLSPGDSGLTIAGVGDQSTVIEGDNAGDAINATSASSLTLDNLELYNPTSSASYDTLVSGGQTDFALNNVVIDNEDQGGYGIDDQTGAIDFNGGSITEGNANGTAAAVRNQGGQVTLSGVTITVAGSGPGVEATAGTVGIAGGSVSSTAGAAVDGGGGTMALQGTTVTATSTGAAVINVGSTTVTDSTLSSGTPGNPVSPVMDLSPSTGYGDTDVVTDSTLHQLTPNEPIVSAVDVNLTFDSSLILGGNGLAFEGNDSYPHTLTVASSTLDAGALGVRDSSPFASVAATSESSSNIRVDIEGSILLEAPTAARTSTGSVTLNCSNTETPDTTQAQTSALGAINCATGSSGNTFTQSLNTIFANPNGTDYALNPMWNGVDSVPSGAISIPSGTPSATDLLGSPRVLNGEGECTPGEQDKGAIELAGHAGIVPSVVISPPANVTAGTAATFNVSAPNDPGATLTDTWRFSDGATIVGASVQHTFAGAGAASATVSATSAGSCSGTASTTFSVGAKPVPPSVDVIGHFKLSPTTFADVTKGSTPIITAKTSNGTVISYTGSEAATTTFTVQYATGGRVTSKGCVKATSKNRKDHACTLYTNVKSFTRADKAGAVSFRFSGRFSNGKLAIASYRLQAIPRNTAGAGPAVYANFRVKS